MMDNNYFVWLLNKIDGAHDMDFMLYRLANIEFRQPIDCDYEAPEQIDHDCVAKPLNERDILWQKEYNRIVEALSLRKDYIDSGISDKEKRELESRFVSVLEVLIAFAIRIDDDMFYEPGENLIPRFFFEFIENLEIDIPNKDWSFENEFFVDQQIKHFLDRTYTLNGEGGNIYVFDWDEVYPKDLRTMSLWDQLQIYLSKN